MGRKKEIDWAELEKELRQNEFLKASVVKNDLQMLICWNTEVLKVPHIYFILEFYNCASGVRSESAYGP